jgi:hypothetical protein
LRVTSRGLGDVYKRQTGYKKGCQKCNLILSTLFGVKSTSFAYQVNSI